MRKKIATFTVAALMVLGSAFGLSACGSPAAHEHIWNDGEVTAQPTCAEEGVKTFACTVKGCKETYTEAVSKLNHTYDGGAVTKPSDCKEEGVKTFTCTACGSTYTEGIKKTEHVWDEGKLTLVPSINAEGETTYTCTVCEETKKESVAPRADFAEQFYNALPSDSEWKYGYAQGYDAQTGEFTFVQIPATDEANPDVWKDEGVEISKSRIYSAHNAVIAYAVAGDMNVNASVSFTGDEEATRVNADVVIISKDGEVKGEPLTLSQDNKDWTFVSEEPLSLTAGDCIYLVFSDNGEGSAGGAFKLTLTSDCIHIWNDGEVTTEPTCHSDGVRTYTCDKCHNTYEEAVTERPFHDFTGDWKSATEGHSRKCINCDAYDTVKPHVHNTENEQKRIPATCHSDGTKFMTCECGDEIQVPITERPPHRYTTQLPDQTKLASCNEDGYTVWQCECGETEHRPISKDTVPHTYTGYVNDGVNGHHQVCEVCGNLTDTEGHFEEVKSIEDSTCAQEGVKTIGCAHCDFTRNESITKKEHVWSETGRKEATADEDGYIDYECDNCEETKRETLSSTPHAAAEGWSSDANGHWHVCTAHTDCGVKLDSAAHTKITKHDKDGHHEECEICEWAGETQAHSWDEGSVTLEPTLTSAGVKTFKCDCGEEKTEEIAAKDSVNYADDFTLESNPNGAWSYGMAKYHFTDKDIPDDKEDFIFIAADKKGEFGWLGEVKETVEENGEQVERIVGECDIRADFLQAKSGFAVIAYTFDGDVDVNVNFKFTGNGLSEGADTKFNVRVGIKNGDTIKGAPEFFNGSTVEFIRDMQFAQGDTIYFIIEHASGWDSGKPELTITKKITEQQ